MISIHLPMDFIANDFIVLCFYTWNCTYYFSNALS